MEDEEGNKKKRAYGKKGSVGRSQKAHGHRKAPPKYAAKMNPATPTPSATTAGLAVVTESKPRKSPAMKSVTVQSPIKECDEPIAKELETQLQKGMTEEQMHHLVTKLFNMNGSGTKATTASTAKENTVASGQVIPPSNSNTRETANASSLRDQINGLDCHDRSPNPSNTAGSGQLFTPSVSGSNKRKSSDVITPYTPNKLAFLTPINKPASAMTTASRRVKTVTKCIHEIGNEEQQVLVLMKTLTDKSMLPMARKLGPALYAELEIGPDVYHPLEVAEKILKQIHVMLEKARADF